MSGTRDEWAEILPLLQAFVAGAQVQTMDFGGRWIDTDQVHSVLTSKKHRLRPPQSRMGVWTRDFTLVDVGSVKGAIGTGTMHWEGADNDVPKWPSKSGLTFTSEAVFTPTEPPK